MAHSVEARLPFLDYRVVEHGFRLAPQWKLRGRWNKYVLRQAMRAVRKGGVLSIPGVYGGLLDKVPFGAVFNKGVTIKTGQTHVQRYRAPLLGHIQRGELDVSFLVTHRASLDAAPDLYRTFRDKRDGCA